MSFSTPQRITSDGIGSLIKTFISYTSNYDAADALVEPVLTNNTIVGGTGSSALLIAQPNAVDVVIELYSNTTATGEPDDTIMTTWAELAGL